MRVGIISLMIISATVQLLSATGVKSQTVDQVEISIELKNESLVRAFQKIEAKTPFHFMYRVQDIKDIRNLNIRPGKQTVAILLEILLGNTSFSYKQLDQRILITAKGRENEDIPGNLKEGSKVLETGVIKGKVTDDKNIRLPGVTVRIEGPVVHTTVTDVNGNYNFANLPEGEYLATFSYLGFTKESRKIILAGSESIINVVMVEQTSTLTDIVVVGYGTQKKTTITGAISTMDNKPLLQSPVANISNSLVGRLPGIIAIQQSGEPGKDQSRIKLRGIGTLSDGVGSDALVLVDGVERNMNQLDPNEIASVSVLKDASSTAVFGVRGANGVIMITTKSGSIGKPTINYSSNFGLQALTAIPQTLDSYDYAMLKNEALKNDGKAPYFSENDLQKYKDGSDPIFHPNINWQEEVLKPLSMQQKHNVNIGGGTVNTKYFLSLGYFSQDGVYRGTDLNQGYSNNPKFKRYNLRSNIDLNITKDFTVTLNVGGQFQDANYTGTTTGTLQPLFQSLLKSNPLGSPGIVDGKLIGIMEGAPGLQVNPWANIVGTGFQNIFGSTFNSNIGLKHKLDFITKGLSVRAMLAYDSFYTATTTRNKPVTTYNIVKDPATLAPIFVPVGEDAPFTFGQAFDRSKKFYTEIATDYSRIFGKHTVTGLVLGTVEKSYRPSLAYKIPAGYMGVAGRITYNYGNRYMAEFNLGYNGSENFPENKRYGLFPAYSLGWNITEEPFFPKNDVVTLFKIRGSYGEVGNDRIYINNVLQRFLYLPTAYSRTGTSYYLGTVGANYTFYPGYQEGLIGNPDVTWERAKKSNIGLETAFFNDKLSIVADVFSEKRDNILTNLGTVPALVQATLPAVNVGKVENKGYELELNFRDKIGEFNYRLGANFSQAKNKIIFQDEPAQPYPYLQKTGNPVGQYFGLVWEGFYNTQEELDHRPVSSWSANNLQLGDMKYKDINGDGIINQNDFMPLGYSAFPQQIFGVSMGGDYKGFDFSVLFQGANKVSTYLNEMAAWPFDTDWATAMEEHLLRWTPERYTNGETIAYPRVTASPVFGQHNLQSSSFLIKDASYIRLKNVEIGYSFSSGFIGKIGLRKVRVFSNANNLLTWTKMKNFDPEAPSGRGEFYPQMKVINFGMNIQF